MIIKHDPRVATPGATWFLAVGVSRANLFLKFRCFSRDLLLESCAGYSSTVFPLFLCRRGSFAVAFLASFSPYFCSGLALACVGQHVPHLPPRGNGRRNLNGRILYSNLL
ncbi:uncharacterized protein TM35_000221860 [Trypanosoma theileri]|uniref:Uncharacterized protein n=1 Tax=Trypanosoma theileri TaxID=67003 RepID=A0A1X0NRS4_9TRYP|nr:uncharacterized protein TM35_000221860 [Trypanosoma theileri]ORC87387.1 hypothetical protein TM35_000221860 [Trypanosoma theileri]